MGVRLHGWQPRAKVREHNAAKFYFFDPGAVRMLMGRLRVGKVDAIPATQFFSELYRGLLEDA